MDYAKVELIMVGISLTATLAGIILFSLAAGVI